MSISMRTQRNPKRYSDFSKEKMKRKIADVVNANSGENSGVSANFTSVQSFWNRLDTNFSFIFKLAKVVDKFN